MWCYSKRSNTIGYRDQTNSFIYFLMRLILLGSFDLRIIITFNLLQGRSVDLFVVNSFGSAFQVSIYCQTVTSNLGFWCPEVEFTLLCCLLKKIVMKANCLLYMWIAGTIHMPPLTVFVEIMGDSIWSTAKLS